MFGKKLHTILAIVFLAAFLSAQFAVYHTFTHEADSIENCKVCDEAITFGHTPVLMPDDAGYEEPDILPDPSQAIVVIYEDPFHEIDYKDYLYSRPPPFSL